MLLIFGFQGTGFFGLQSQSAEGTPGQPTVADAIRKALLDSGAIIPSNFAPLSRTKWQLASRTDKGVHAARAAVSLKMETLASQVEPLVVVGACADKRDGSLVQLTAAAVAEINTHLPPEVRLFGGFNVRKGFDARECASSRTYEYLLPRSALRGMPVAEFDALLSQFQGTHKVHATLRWNPQSKGLRPKSTFNAIPAVHTPDGADYCAFQAPAGPGEYPSCAYG